MRVKIYRQIENHNQVEFDCDVADAFEVTGTTWDDWEPVAVYDAGDGAIIEDGALHFARSEVYNAMQILEGDAPDWGGKLTLIVRQDRQEGPDAD